MAKFFGIAKGTTRVVLLIGKYAVKFPLMSSWTSFATGWVANLTEKRVSAVCPNYFLPIKWASWSGLFIVFPRVKVVRQDNWLPKAFLTDLHDQANDDNDEALVARRYCEYLPANYAMYMGRPVCIDYGTRMEPRNVEETLNMELTYWRHKLDVKINGPEVANKRPFWDVESKDEDCVEVSVSKSTSTLDIEQLDIPAFTANVESALVERTHGLVGVETKDIRCAPGTAHNGGFEYNQLGGYNTI